MLNREAITCSVFGNTTTMVGWYRRQRRQQRRRKCSTIWLGNKRMKLRSRSRLVLHCRVVASPLFILKKFIMKMVSKERFMEAYYLTMPILKPQLFPMC
ncbi:hypothetical protein HanRHA438_Chr01g0005131 [Helianthus annuus]|nr:hypothetical protein HanRHA438_Chr01g0005131 [Helianthus annuus]